MREGFSYHLSFKKIKEYRKVSSKNKLLWLYYGNLLRHKYPKKIVKRHKIFRGDTL